MFALELIARRCLLAIVTLLVVSAVVFAMVEVLPGDVASRILGRLATEENLAVLRAQLNLDVPPIQRYGQWLAGMLQGDFGVSLTTNRPVLSVLGARIANTLVLAGIAFVLYIPLALVPAAVQALHRDQPLDHGISMVTLVLFSTPEFLLATLLLLMFVLVIPILPATSLVDETSTFREYAEALVLPAATLALVMSTHAMRMLRDNLIEILQSDYIKMAELNGLTRRSIVWRHALPNALTPTLNITALNLAYLIGGVVIVEKVFSFPGFGSLLVDALLLRDAPLIEATVLIAAAVYIGANLFADIGAILLNPRLRSR